jgi:flagellin
VADINKTDPVVASIAQRRVQQTDGIAALVREAKGAASRDIDFEGVGLRSDRISVVASSRFTQRVNELKEVAQNAAQASSVLDIADRALSDIQDKLDRMSEIATSASSARVEREDGSFRDPEELSARERALLDNEFVLLRQEIDDRVDDAKFNGRDLLKGDPDSEGDPLELSFKVRATGGEGDSVDVELADARAAAISDDLEAATLASEADADAAKDAVEDAADSIRDIRAAVRSARSQIDSVESAAGEVSAILSRERDAKVTPDSFVEISRVVADRITRDRGIDLNAGTERILQDVLLRASASTANGGPATGGDGIETFGGKTAGAPAIESAGGPSTDGST